MVTKPAIHGQNKAEEEKASPPPPPADIVLLTEIRDLLREKNGDSAKNGDKP